jgi:GTP-binding protein LepA
MPDPTKIEKMEEPWIKATIMTPDEFLGSVLDLCTQKRGVQKELTYVGERAMLIYRLPLNEIVYDFYDRLKSCSRGYASFDWQMDGYEDSQLVKLTIIVNAEPVDALSYITHKTRAENR